MEIIKVRNLSKRFNGFLAVDNISFSVRRGEIYAYRGANGAGKTATIKMLTTLLQPSEGKISINNFDPKINQGQVRSSIGIGFQDPSLDDDLTGLENLQFHGVLYKVPVKLRIPRIRELLQLVELWDRKNHLVKTFSGGMKRRLEIARGLLHRPKIFFLDEPTLGLDPQTRNKTWNYLKQLNKKEQITIFFTTHYIEEAEKIAHNVAIIDQGKIIAHGPPGELIKKYGKKSLEEAFLELTGHAIREEQAGSIDQLRMGRRLWRG